MKGEMREEFKKEKASDFQEFYDPVPFFDIQKLEKAPIPFVWKGKPFEMFFEDRAQEGSECIVKDIAIEAKGDGSTTCVDVQIKDYDGQLTSMIQVRKFFDDDKIDAQKASGLGRALLVKAMAYLQDQADCLQRDIVDYLEARPDITSYEPLTAKRWLEIFHDLLITNGYRSLGHGIYKKIYVANKRNP